MLLIGSSIHLKHSYSYLLYYVHCFLCSNMENYVLANLFIRSDYLLFTDRSIRPEVFCRKGVLRNFAKFTGKHLRQSLLFNKVAGLRPKACNFIKKEILEQVLSCEFCGISKNTFFYRTPLVAASVLKISEWRIKLVYCFYIFSIIPANKYILTVSNRNIGKRCEICSKVTIKHQNDVNDVVLVSSWIKMTDTQGPQVYSKKP